VAGADDLVLRILATPEGQADPYPLYRELRDLAPVHRSAMGDVWYASRFATCRQLLRDPRAGKSARGPRSLVPGGETRTRVDRGRASMLFLDPPEHTRIRSLFSRAFTPRRVEAMRAKVEALTDEILDELPHGSEVDLIDALAFPLPVRVIGELVGVPPADRDGYRELVRAMAQTLEPVNTEEQVAAAHAAGATMTASFAELVAERRRRPTDDLLSALVEVRDGTDRLAEDELIANVILLFAAGFETTTNLIGNGVLTLLRHPEQLALLRTDPGLCRTAVEEILRYESPVQLDAREAHETLELGGETIEPGHLVVTLLGAANRDPEAVPDPDRFDIGRAEVPLLSFATGIHHCLGAALARLEGQVVLQRLLDRYPRIELLDPAPRWRTTLTLRGLTSLPVRLG
jgi:cytochrome P450